MHIPDVLADPEYVYSGPFAYRALLGVPIEMDEDLIGVVVLVRWAPEPFGHAHIALVETFADQAAIAVANARLIDAVERQRTELSRFVSPQVAELISSRDGERLLAGIARTSPASSAISAASPRSPRPPRPRSSSSCCASTTGRSGS